MWPFKLIDVLLVQLVGLLADGFRLGPCAGLAYVIVLGVKLAVSVLAQRPPIGQGGW